MDNANSAVVPVQVCAHNASFVTTNGREVWRYWCTDCGGEWTDVDVPDEVLQRLLMGLPWEPPSPPYQVPESGGG